MAYYERGKRILHPTDTIENLKILENMLKEQHPSQIEKLDKTLDELKEIVSRFIPQKPDGEWIAGRDGYSCPLCPCCGARVRSGNGTQNKVRDNRCRKCGQLIDWSN